MNGLRIFLLGVSALLIVVAVIFFLDRKETVKVDGSQDASESSRFASCPIKEKKFTVRGESLRGVIDPGEEITALVGYYACHEAERGDVVLYNYAGNSDHIIKIVKGIPGDSLVLGEAAGGSRILINKEVARTSANNPYLLDERSSRLLSLYIKDYNGVIPAEAYLLLGNVESGTLDSTRFGLVGKKDIVGKVIY